MILAEGGEGTYHTALTVTVVPGVLRPSLFQHVATEWSSRSTPHAALPSYASQLSSLDGFTPRVKGREGQGGPKREGSEAGGGEGGEGRKGKKKP